MTTTNNKFMEQTETDLLTWVHLFVGDKYKSKSDKIARDILNLIDWNSEALMHKGLSWIVKSYLIKENMFKG